MERCVRSERDDFGQQALVVSSEMRDDDESDAGIWRHVVEQQLQGLDASGGGADSGYQQVLI